MVSCHWCVSRYHDLFTTKTNDFCPPSVRYMTIHFPLSFLLGWWYEMRYQIYFSHFYSGGLGDVLKWWNVRAHKRFFFFFKYHWLPSYPYVRVHISWLAAAIFDLFLHCVWLYYLPTKGKALWCLQRWGQKRARQIFVPSRLSVLRQPFLTKLGSVVHHHEREYRSKKNCFCLQGQDQGHNKGLYKYDGFYHIFY